MKSFISFVLRKHPSTFVPATRYTFLPISALEKWTVVSFAAARAGVTQRSPSQETKRTGIAVLWQWPSSFISFVLRKHSPWGHLGWFSSTFVPQRAVSLCSKRSRDRAKEFFRLTRRRKNSFVRSNFQYFNFPILRDPILFPFTGRDLMYTHHESPVRNWMVRWCYLMVHWIIKRGLRSWGLVVGIYMRPFPSRLNIRLSTFHNMKWKHRTPHTNPLIYSMN